MYRIAIIGAGQLGSRHLQALAKLDFEIQVAVVDPSNESLKTAEERYAQVESDFKKIITINYLNTINALEDNIDLAIIATNSDVRLKVIKAFLERNEPNYLILEKVLFSRVEEYYESEELLQKYKTRVWVNCSRRMWDFYTELKSNLKEMKIISVNVYGEEWGLASNFIHMIDLISYIAGYHNYRIESFNPIGDFHSSKRKGYVEFNGVIKGKFEDKLEFAISSFKNSKLPFLIQIITDSEVHIIHETIGKHYISSLNTHWSFEEKSFKVPYQSDLTNLLIKEVLSSGKCNLVSFADSVKLHLPYIKFMNGYFNKIENKDFSECLIT